MLSPPRWSPLARHVRLVSDSVSAGRRGRNLTERYRRLENSARIKSERAAHLSVLSNDSIIASLQPDVALTAARTPTIAGFVIPKELRVPADDGNVSRALKDDLHDLTRLDAECCMSGCAVCVYDLYEEELSTYKASVATLRTALTAGHIPEPDWPAHIRTHTGKVSLAPTLTAMKKSKGAVLDAFGEMERALKEKREKRAAVEAEKRARGEVLAGDGEQEGLDLKGVYEGIKWVIFPNR